MQVIRNERVIPFDIDGTLITRFDQGDPVVPLDTVEILSPYDGELKFRKPHWPHINLLNNYLARGAQLIVWSKNGVRWAEAVLSAQGIEHENIIVMTKPIVHVDDQPCETWMGERVFMKPDDEFGED